MTPEQQDEIDKMSYRELLHKWRFAESSPLFQGECGMYYAQIMNEKRDALPAGEQVAISKSIG